MSKEKQAKNKENTIKQTMKAIKRNPSRTHGRVVKLNCAEKLGNKKPKLKQIAKNTVPLNDKNTNCVKNSKSTKRKLQLLPNK